MDSKAELAFVECIVACVASKRLAKWGSLQIELKMVEQQEPYFIKHLILSLLDRSTTFLYLLLVESKGSGFIALSLHHVWVGAATSIFHI